MVMRIVGFEGMIEYDGSKPDGVAKKLLDVSRISSLGWKPKINLEEGIQKAYDIFKKYHFSK